MQMSGTSVSAVTILSEEAGSRPISHSEMQTLLQPLHGILQRLEGTLSILSGTVNTEVGGKDVQRLSFEEKGPFQALANVANSQPDVLEGNGRYEDLPNHSGDLGDTIGTKPTDRPPEQWPWRQAVAKASSVSSQWSCDLGDTIAPKLTDTTWDQGVSHQHSMWSSGQGLQAQRVQRVSEREVIEIHEGANVVLGDKGSKFSETHSKINSDFVEMMRIKQSLQIHLRDPRKDMHAMITGLATDIFLLMHDLLKEPHRHGRLHRLSVSTVFQTWCMFVVVLNSSMVAYNVDWQMTNIGMEEPASMIVLEIACLCWFTIELLIRMGVHGCYFFVNLEAKWNTFDFCLVCISLLDLLLDELGLESNSGNIGFMRLVRLLKLAKILRAFRTFRFFSSLAQLLDSLHKSLMSMFWGFIMLAFMLYLFSLVFMQAMLGVLQSASVDPDTRHEIMSSFGDLYSTLVTLYMSVTGGNDWSVAYDTVLHAGMGYGLAFLLYTFVMQFALFNILTGLLVEKAFVSNKPDRAERILAQRRKIAEQTNEFMTVCKAIDTDESGSISWQEFQDNMADPVLEGFLSYNGIEIDDVHLFFLTVLGLSEGEEAFKTKQIPVEQLVRACMHMKGTATAIDMQRLLLESHCQMQELKHLRASLADLCQKHENGNAFAKSADGAQNLEDQHRKHHTPLPFRVGRSS